MKILPMMLFLILWMVVFTGCGTCASTLERTTRTIHKEQKSLAKDSVYVEIKDSVLIYIRGDTVIKKYYQRVYRDRFRDRVDTLVFTDTLQVQQTKYIKEKREFSGWQWFQVWCGRVLLLILGLWLIVKGIKR